MKQVLFVVHLDKFTQDFYRFICSYFKKQDNYFLFYGSQHEFDFEVDDNRVFWCDSYDALKKHSIVKVAKKCDLILYSGLFGSENCVKKFGFNSLKKTYIHLWGGDFYVFRKLNSYGCRTKIKFFFRRFVIDHAAGIINLLPDEYLDLCKLCRPKGISFVAPMCGDGSVIELINSLKDSGKSVSPVKILLGNSATDSNQHVKALKMLEKFKNENIKIICPLSYGDETYRNKVIDFGKRIFGEKFYPIVSYMDKEQYYGIIAGCTIAIFNNNRQQAIGNINAALALNCKVFIRNDTPMWNTYYEERKMELYNVEDIEHMNFSDFICLKPNNNYSKYLEYADITKRILSWQKIFDSVEECNEQ